MTLVFTICSSNYLAHAKVLGDSLAETNPDCRFVIGLVDSIPTEIDLSTWMSYEVIPVTEIGIEGFDEMSEKYNIVELNTAVKPFYMEYFYQEDAGIDHVIYLDPDIVVYHSVSPLTNNLAEHNMIVTPHSCTYDNSEDNLHYETTMLMTGVYNLGFIATARSAETSAFLTWWQIRLRKYCYYLPSPGLFVDQIWVTLAPLYFEGFFVEKDPGYNMCYWNHFERILSHEQGGYKVNRENDLIFYHFSSYKSDNPDKITNRDNQPIATFDERPDLKPLYDDYHKRLIGAGINDVSSLKCAFGRKPPLASVKPRTVEPVSKKLLRKLLSGLPVRLRNLLGRAAGSVMACCKD
ncbi:glycosyl transferase [Pseudomonadota bacterium]